MSGKDDQQNESVTIATDTDDTQTVVTDDLEKFESEFTGRAKPAPAADDAGDADEGEGEDTGDQGEGDDADEGAVNGDQDGDAGDEEEGEGEEDGKDDKRKPNKKRLSARERVQQAVTRQREAERRAEAAEAEAERLRAGGGQDKDEAGDKPVQRQGGGEFKPSAELTPENAKRVGEEPDPEKYELGANDGEYLADLATHRAYKRMVLDQQQAEETAAHNASIEAQQQAAQDWTEKKAKALEKYPDYHEKVTEAGRAGKWACTPVMGEAIRESDVGTDIAYHLATHPAEAQRIAQLSETGQARAIGRLEMQFEEEETPKKADKPAEGRKRKIITDAPEPAAGRARGAGGTFETPDSTDDLDAFERKFYKQPK